MSTTFRLTKTDLQTGQTTEQTFNLIEDVQSALLREFRAVRPDTGDDHIRKAFTVWNEFADEAFFEIEVRIKNFSITIKETEQ
jgi:hypothetical protein